MPSAPPQGKVPGRFGTDFLEQVPGVKLVSGIEPEHAFEIFLGLLEAALVRVPSVGVRVTDAYAMYGMRSDPYRGFP